MQYLLINYCDPNNFTDEITLTYKLRDHSLVGKWIDRVKLAQSQYEIDNPGRFYGFGSAEQQAEYALAKIAQCIDIINQHQPIIDRYPIDVNDQDTLNYLHHVFEEYHGLLDEQDTDYWLAAPDDVRVALADLNILVHRCESVDRGADPRHVVTWYGLPKTEVLDLDDYKLFEPNIEFGTVYLNYVEIGKTFDDLAIDNDQYIGDNAFQPFRHYSADFNVKFWSTTDRQVAEHRAILNAYFKENSEFFAVRNLTLDHPYMVSGAIPLADLVDDNKETVVSVLETRQWVKSVNFI
jgi:hypothetical protein